METLDKIKHNINVSALIETIILCSEHNTMNLLKDKLKNFRPEDVAAALTYLNKNIKIEVFNLLNIKFAAKVLSETDEISEKEIILSLTTEKLSAILEELPSDDATDIINRMDKDRADIILPLIAQTERARIEKLKKHDPETAGGRMHLEFFTLNKNLTVGQAIKKIKQITQLNQTPFYHIYLVDDNNKFEGIVPVRRLLISSDDEILNTLKVDNPITAYPEMDQEEVADLFNKYNLLSIPVIDENNIISGIITVDDVLEVIEEEATEDIYKLVGTDDEEFSTESAFKRAKIRFPWLIICLIGELFSGTVIKSFGADIQKIFVLTFFVPVIMAMGGNVGLQSSTLTVRGIALNQLNKNNIIRWWLREIRTSLIMGILCGVVVAMSSVFFVDKQDLIIKISIAVGLAMFFAIMISSTVGTIFPFILNSLKFDPALASGPFVTTFNDVFGLLIYFTISIFILNLLGALA